MPVGGVYRRGPQPDQHLVFAGFRRIDFACSRTSGGPYVVLTNAFIGSLSPELVCDRLEQPD